MVIARDAYVKELLAIVLQLTCEDSGSMDIEDDVANDRKP